MIFLSGIAIKVARGEDLVSANNVLITVEKGIEGDVRGAGGEMRRRQITVVSGNQIRDAYSDMGWSQFGTSWTLRRAGLCFEGVWFDTQHLYHRHQIRIGEEVVLEITSANPPCGRMDKIAPGFKDVLAVGMRSGVACRVIQGGRIATGNNVIIEPIPPP